MLSSHSHICFCSLINTKENIIQSLCLNSWRAAASEECQTIYSVSIRQDINVERVLLCQVWLINHFVWKPLKGKLKWVDDSSEDDQFMDIRQRVIIAVTSIAYSHWSATEQDTGTALRGIKKFLLKKKTKKLASHTNKEDSSAQKFPECSFQMSCEYNGTNCIHLTLHVTLTTSAFISIFSTQL